MADHGDVFRAGRGVAVPENTALSVVSVAVYHCGAGCTLGDIIGEAGLSAIGGSVATFVAGEEFATKLVVDFILAYVLGIFFQYFTIVPMRGLSPGEGILAAMRADTISFTAFEIGMFASMVLTRFVFFPEPTRIHPNIGSGLVHDADCNDCRVGDLIPGEQLAHSEGMERKDADVSVHGSDEGTQASEGGMSANLWVSISLQEQQDWGTLFVYFEPLGYP